MSLDSSLNQTLRELDSVRKSETPRQALLVVSPDGRIQFAMARADLWMKDLFTAAYPSDRLPEELTRWLCHGFPGGQSPRLVVEKGGKPLGVQLLCRDSDSVCLLLDRP